MQCHATHKAHRTALHLKGPNRGASPYVSLQLFFRASQNMSQIRPAGFFDVAPLLGHIGHSSPNTTYGSLHS
jgi:hypothetical protein